MQVDGKGGRKGDGRENHRGQGQQLASKKYPLSAELFAKHPEGEKRRAVRRFGRSLICYKLWVKEE